MDTISCNIVLSEMQMAKLLINLTVNKRMNAKRYGNPALFLCRSCAAVGA
jgi:hypothetical protein